MAGRRIIATKPLLIRTITNENAWCATVREFIRPVRSKTRKALTPKGTKIAKIWRKMK